MSIPDKITCNKCGSNQLAANKKGFGGKKAVIGGVLMGAVGLLAGTLGSKDILITCLNCGNNWEPGKQHEADRPNKFVEEEKMMQESKLWKRKFKYAVINNNKDDAQRLLDGNHSLRSAHPTVDGAYKFIRTNEKQLVILVSIGIGLIATAFLILKFAL